MTRPEITFPHSDVRFISGQNLFFGDSFNAYIVHNGTSGDLELKSNADVKILGAQLDLDGADIDNVDDIFSITSGSIDLKADTTIRAFPEAQTTIGLTIDSNSSDLLISGAGTGVIDILDNLTVQNHNVHPWLYNQSAIVFTQISNQNASWISTFNSTYSPFAYNQTLASGWTKIGTNVILGVVSDRVGIGTPTPSHNFTVNGHSNLSGNIYMHNTVVWWNGTCLNTNVSGVIVQSVGCA